MCVAAVDKDIKCEAPTCSHEMKGCQSLHTKSLSDDGRRKRRRTRRIIYIREVVILVRRSLAILSEAGFESPSQPRSLHSCVNIIL